MNSPLLSLGASVKAVRGVGPGLSQHLTRLGLHTVEDLAQHYPTAHEDRRHIVPIGQLLDGDWAAIEGEVRQVREKAPNRKLQIVEATVCDPSGCIVLTFFNQPHVKHQLSGSLRAYGKVERKIGQMLQMNGPDMERVSDKPSALFGRLVPVYPLTQGIVQRVMRRIVVEVLRALPPVPEVVSEDIRQRYRLMPRRRAIVQLHYPAATDTLAAAQRTLAFEEFFVQQIGVRLKRMGRAVQPRLTFYPNLDVVDPFEALLPFPPTGAQRRAFQDVLKDLRAPHPMARLVQGDVGCGKTVVAAFAACCAVWNGCQAAVMAPTEILAGQHAQKLSGLLPGIRVGLLMGSLRTKEKAQVQKDIASGAIQVVVGTHALIQEAVRFDRLGLVVVDEQHKFGVVQRTRLWEKGDAPDLLVMTATPIPRTLSLTTYGDLDCTIIDELPPGRTPVKTHHIGSNRLDGAYKWIREQVREGRQAYVVCPLIEESEKLELASAQQVFAHLRDEVFPELRLALLHGRQKADEKEAVMGQFRSGDFDVLVSTTVIEVGVDVPNATVMLIRDADRFGLAQLHQLRGRVGRGAHRSHCILVADPESKNGKERMECLVQSQDGFFVAEEDMRLRGPGDYYGTRQAGFMQLRVADMALHRAELEMAREAAEDVLRHDAGLSHPQWEELRRVVERNFPGSEQHFH
ncbi:MAG TPA: ATP-dependent DNA helicase RecG [Candidatus Xenobia bacterium]|jgi:ATP-dependent DNA helicase RecG